MAQLAAVAAAARRDVARVGDELGELRRRARRERHVASALWGTDMLFGLADAGVRNVNFHTWTGALYAPVDFAVHRGHVAAQVRPLFYAMLLFDRATPHGSRLLPVGPNPDAGRSRRGRRSTRRARAASSSINKDPDDRRARSSSRVPGAGGRAQGRAARRRRR